MARLIVPVTARDHVRGGPEGHIAIVEYGDYECPHCGEAYPILRAFARERPEVRFVFRHFPLTQTHPRAELAAEAAEAAAAQGKFWEMHDLLFTHQHALEQPHLEAYAETLGLDLPSFRDSLARHAFAERIREDVMGALRSGVDGTPSFFVNNLRHRGAFTLDVLRAAVGGDNRLGSKP